MQLSLLDFLNAAVCGDGFAPSLAAQLRLNLFPRHLRAHALLLQFGAGSVREPQRGEFRKRLRHFGSLCCGRRLLPEQLQTSLLRSLMTTAAGPYACPRSRSPSTRAS